MRSACGSRWPEFCCNHRSCKQLHTFWAGLCLGWRADWSIAWTMRAAITILGLMLLLTAGGCARHAAYHPQVLAGETFTINGPQLIVDTALLQQAQASHSPGTWQDSRNDAWLNVRRNAPRGESVRYVVFTEDRVQTFGGRVHDVHRRITYSSRSGQIVR